MKGRRGPRVAVWFATALAQGGLIGCDAWLGKVGPPAPEARLAPTSVRADRRAYDGAPPVIPHPVLGGACVNCHDRDGMALPGVGIAPPNPHLKTAGLSEASNCRQCHLFANDRGTFAASTFEGLAQDLRPGWRAHDGAPPAIPHHLWMREDCAACHVGQAARPEIACTHPERTNCVQCHLAAEATVGPFPAPGGVKTGK